MKSYEALADFLSCETNFIMKLRWLKGLDRESIEQFMQILDDVGAEIKDAALIEKRLAFILLETVAILYGCESLYAGERRQEIANEVGYIQQKISSILECET